MLSLPVLTFAQDWEAVTPPVDHPWISLFNIQKASDGSIFTIDKPNIPPFNSNVYRTLDQGTTWETFTVPVDTSITNPLTSAVFALDSTHFWVSLTNNLPTEEPPFFGDAQRIGLYFTADGGQNWEDRTPVIDSARQVIEEIHFYHPDTGLVFTSSFPLKSLNTEIFRTTDGGLNWTSVGPALDSFESRIMVGQHQNVYLGDTIWTGTINGRILRSIDRGENWEIFDTGLGADRNINSIAFQDHQTGLAVVDQYPFITDPPNSVIKTTDGGATWTIIDGPERVEVIGHVPNSGGVYFGRIGSRLSPGYFLSKDGGDTWIRNEEPGFFTPIYFLSPTEGYASGNGIEFLGNFTGFPFLPKLTFQKYTGEALMYDPNYANELIYTSQAIDELPEHYGIFSIDIVDENTVWATAFDRTVGNMIPPDHQSLVLKTTDGGDTWVTYAVDAAPGRVCFDIEAFDANTAMVTTQDNGSGQGKGIFKTEDGGQTWMEAYDHPSGGVWLHFFDEMEGLAINRNAMSKTTDGGSTWDTIPATNFPAFNDDDVTLINSGNNTLASVGDHVWFGTNNGLVYHSRDRGNNWTADTTLAGVSVRTLAFKDTLNGLAISPYFFNGGFNVPVDVLRTTDGGTTWENLNDSPEAFNYYDITNITYVPNTANTYVATSSFWDNLAMYTQDGGETWSVMPDVVPFGSVAFMNATTGWIARGSGAPMVATPAIYKYNGDLFTEVLSTKNKARSLESVTVFPNPTMENLQVDIPERVQNDRLMIILTDIQGKVVKQFVNEQAQPNETIQVADLVNGTYFIRLYSPNGQYQGQFIKQ